MRPCQFSCLLVARGKMIKAFLNFPISWFKFGLESDFFKAQNIMRMDRCFQADVSPPKKGEDGARAVQEVHGTIRQQSWTSKGYEMPTCQPHAPIQGAKKSALPLNSQPEREKNWNCTWKKKTISGIEATSEEIFWWQIWKYSWKTEPENFQIRTTLLFYNSFLLPASVRDFSVSIKPMKVTEHVRKAHHQEKTYNTTVKQKINISVTFSFKLQQRLLLFWVEIVSSVAILCYKSKCLKILFAFR